MGDSRKVGLRHAVRFELGARCRIFEEIANDTVAIGTNSFATQPRRFRLGKDANKPAETETPFSRRSFKDVAIDLFQTNGQRISHRHSVTRNRITDK